MKVKFVYKVLPAFILYASVTKPFNGTAYMCIVDIEPTHKDDEGLLQHELVHVKQWYRTFGWHSLLYYFKWYRLKAEVEAYKVQFKYNPENIDIFAEFIATRYGLDITKDEAHVLLRQK